MGEHRLNTPRGTCCAQKATQETWTKAESKKYKREQRSEYDTHDDEDEYDDDEVTTRKKKP